MSEQGKNIKSFFGNSGKGFMQLFTVYSMAAVITGVVEILYGYYTFGSGEAAGILVLQAFVKTFFVLLPLCVMLYIFYSCCFFFSKKLADFVLITVAILLLITQMALAKYFLTALVPLGGDIWGYSLQEVKQTVGAGGALSAGMVIFGVVIIASLVLLFIYVPHKISISLYVAPVLLVLSITANICAVAAKADQWKASAKEFDNALTTNKLFFFWHQSVLHFFPPVFEVDIYADNYIDDPAAAGIFSMAAAFSYVDEQSFPFLHQNAVPDVLGSFFDSTAEKPNIVFIIVEGLGRSFANEDAPLGNFTPFLDSLSKQSLYWPNFLSEGGRTFAVLPSLLGSLPFGENGFAELGNTMPHNINLLNTLHHNGYESIFYYGGDAHFDNMDLFVKNSNGMVQDMRSFPAGYTKQPSENGFSWGYGDKDLFRFYLSQLPAKKQPALDVLLTVSMHSPFKINEQEKYLGAAEDRISKIATSEAEKSMLLKFKPQFASVLYTDDALRNFISQYAQQPSFRHTIFVITGDHRMPEIPMENKLERYHVPLIVYSPMLSRTATFRAVSTHFDVAPTLLSFLNHRYNIAVPSQTTFIGTGLDTSRAFGNVHAYPLKQTKTDLVDFIYGNYLLNNNQLFEITNKMDLIPVNDESIKVKITAAFNGFRQKNEMVKANSRLVPDSLYRHYQTANTPLAVK